MRRTLRRRFVALLTIAILVASVGRTPRAESVEPPTFPKLVRGSSVYVVTPVRLDVARKTYQSEVDGKTFQLGATAWHVFRIEETLRSSPQVTSPLSWGCGRRPETSVALSSGEIVLPFTGDGGIDSTFPKDWDRLPLVTGHRYLAIVNECGDGIGDLPFGPVNFLEVSQSGALIPGVRTTRGTSEFDSLDKVRRLIADLASADADKPPSGLLVGRTVDAATGSPLGDVSVGLTGIGEQAVRSTADGWFFFRNLPTFAYTLRAFKAGWFVDDADEVAARVKLPAGGRRGDIVLRLRRSPTMEGHVRDEADRPLVNIYVQCFKVSTNAGGRPSIIGTGYQVRTDDRGHFVFTGLTPGDYMVAAQVYRLPTAEPNQQRGHLYYPLTFYPSATALGVAGVITVSTQNAPSDVDIQVRPLAARQIAGTVQRAGTGVSGASLSLERVDPQFDIDRNAGGFGSVGGRAAADGSFVFDNLVPASYVVSAIRSGEPPERWTSQVITITDRDVTGFAIDLPDTFKVDTSMPPAPAAIPRDGSGRLEGIVRDASDNGLLNRTLVTLTNVVTQKTRKQETDPAGRFGFAGLAAGRYALATARDGYVTTPDASPAASRSDPLEVVAGETKTADLVMSRGGVVTGVVFDEAGIPLKGAGVGLRPYEIRDGVAVISRNRIYVPVGGMKSVESDDQGRYRIFGVPPGDYLVATQKPARQGIASDLSPEDVTRARADVAARPAVQSGAPGQRPVPVENEPVRRRTASTARQPLEVFHPSTTDPMSATRIHVSAASDTSGKDIQLIAEYPVRVTGTVRVETGSLRANLVVSLVRMDVLTDGSLLAYAVRDNAFTASDVPPGHYAVIARTAPSVRDPDAYLWGRTDIQVGAGDIEGAEVVLRPTARLRVRVVRADGGSLGPTPILVSVTPVDRSVILDSAPVAAGTTSRVAADGTLLLMGIVPGRYRVSVASGSNEPVPWIVQSVAVDGVAVGDSILDIQRSDTPGDVVVRLGTR
jgi:hypothetical protein